MEIRIEAKFKITEKMVLKIGIQSWTEVLEIQDKIEITEKIIFENKCLELETLKFRVELKRIL